MISSRLKTLPFTESKNDEKKSSEKKDLSYIVKPSLEAQASQATRKIKIRRKYMWKNFRSYLKRTSIKRNTNLYVQFIGEPGADESGPRREFFTGKKFIKKHTFFYVS